MDGRAIGQRVKKSAVLHPYVSQLKVAAVGAGDGKDLLDALRVVDEPTGTPRGARSISELRYEVTLIGPQGTQFGVAVDDLTMNPGDAKWRRHATAILDNPEGLLATSFAYSKKPIDSARES